MDVQAYQSASKAHQDHIIEGIFEGQKGQKTTVNNKNVFRRGYTTNFSTDNYDI